MAEPKFMPGVTVLEYINPAWHSHRFETLAFLQQSWSPRVCVNFLSSDDFSLSETLRRDLCVRYKIPSSFWTRASRQSNGFFGCTDHFDDEGQRVSHATWFRFVIKVVSPKDYKYTWHEMGFFSLWVPDHLNVMLCFDMPPMIQNAIKSLLTLHEIPCNLYDMYCLHAVIVEEIVERFESSVWAIRDIVRNIEKKRTRDPGPETDYPLLHDIARHSIHASESILAAENTMESILKQHVVNSPTEETTAGPRLATFRIIQQQLEYQIQIIRNLRARSKANEDRLRNEISLSFNVVAQGENRMTTQLAKSSERHSAAMKTVSVITMVFLPATFLSTIFSMQFFQFIPGSDSTPQLWVVSKELWLYWAFAIPLTILSISVWFMWQRRLG